MNQDLPGLGNGTAKTLTRNCRHVLSPFSTQNSILQPSYWRGLWLCHTVDDRPGHQSTHYQGFKILTTYILIIIIQPLKLDHVVYVLTHKCSWYPLILERTSMHHTILIPLHTVVTPLLLIQ